MNNIGALPTKAFWIKKMIQLIEILISTLLDFYRYYYVHISESCLIGFAQWNRFYTTLRYRVLVSTSKLPPSSYTSCTIYTFWVLVSRSTQRHWHCVSRFRECYRQRLSGISTWKTFSLLWMTCKIQLPRKRDINLLLFGSRHS